jgi:hypothetical protein
MDAGIQIWNDSGYLQIDGVNQHICLLRKGTVNGTGIPNGINNGDPDDPQTTQLAIPVNPGELVAFNGPTPTAVAGWYGNQTQFHLFGPPASSPLNYWIFGPYTPSGDRFGVLLRDGNGIPIWDTGRPPMRVVGDVQGIGTFSGYSPGRQLALICWQQYAALRIASPAQQNNGSYVGIQLFTAGFARADTSGNVFISNNTYTADPYGPAYPPPGFTDGGWSNGLDNRYTVVDVTGY